MQTFRVCLVQYRGEKERRNLLIIYMFGSKERRGREGRNFNCKYVWFMRGGMIKLNYFFILIILLLQFHNFKIIRYINI
jgi:hypothetical protein